MKVIGDLMGHIAARIQGRRILYVGAGNLQGGISENTRIIQRVASEWHAIDFDPELVRKYPDLKIILVDLDDPIQVDLPAVDFVVITEVLEHLRSPVASLRNLGRKLPGTRVIGSVPNALSFGRIVSALWNSNSYAGNDGSHLMVFNPRTLGRTLAQAGLTDVTICAYDRHVLLRPFTCLRPDFSQGLYFEGAFPKG